MITTPRVAHAQFIVLRESIRMPLSVREDRPAYPALSALLDGDDGRVEMVVRVFYHSSRHDLRQMEDAVGAGYWTLVRQLAHRLASACRHVGEDAVADSLVAVERAPCEHADASPIARLFEDARNGLVLALDRAAIRAGIGDPDTAIRP